MITPQGYKQTEFGPIPLNWDLCTFKDVLATFSSGATPYRGIPEYYNGDVRWISSGELNYNHIYDTLEHISQQAVRNTNLRIHKPGTFLMAITGLEAEGTRGRCAFVGAPSATNQSCLAINGTDKMCAEYLFWFYRMWGQYLAFKYCQGTKQQSYTADIVKKLPIYGPKDIAEQRAIAEALSDVDGLIAALDKKIAKKRLLKQGAMQQLLTGKKRLPGFTDEWVEKPIRLLCKLYGRIGFRGYTKADIVHKGEGAITFSPSDIHEQVISYTNCDYISWRKYDESPEIQVFNGDIIFCKTASIGKCAIIKNLSEKATINPQFVVLKDFKCNNEWLYYSIIDRKFQTVVSGITGGSTIPTMSQEKLYEQTLLCPPTIEEQQAIATILSDMDKEIADLEAQRNKYRLLKSGMMQKLLTGQIRLKTE